MNAISLNLSGDAIDVRTFGSYGIVGLRSVEGDSSNPLRYVQGWGAHVRGGASPSRGIFKRRLERVMVVWGKLDRQTRYRVPGYLVTEAVQ